MKKRFKALGTIALAVLGFAPALFSQQTAGDYQFVRTQDGRGVAITKYTGREASVKIPETLNGLPVVELRGTFGEYHPAAGWMPNDSLRYVNLLRVARTKT